MPGRTLRLYIWKAHHRPYPEVEWSRGMLMRILQGHSGGYGVFSEGQEDLGRHCKGSKAHLACAIIRLSARPGLSDPYDPNIIMGSERPLILSRSVA
jgi:hypothetical protein